DFFVYQKEKLIKKSYNNIDKFIKYLEYTYFGIFIDNIYKTPVFEIKKWSIHNRILQYDPITTNGAESWHRVINKKINISFPNIALFIKTILEDEEIKKFEILQTLPGNVTWPRKNFDKQQKLFLLMSDINYFSDNEFILSVLNIYNFNFK
ncbi:MAG: hypothetical protein RR483_06800, partial [Clostridia bacterium]